MFTVFVVGIAHLNGCNHLVRISVLDVQTGGAKASDLRAIRVLENLPATIELILEPSTGKQWRRTGIHRGNESGCEVLWLGHNCRRSRVGLNLSESKRAGERIGCGVC